MPQKSEITASVVEISRSAGCDVATVAAAAERKRIPTRLRNGRPVFVGKDVATLIAACLRKMVRERKDIDDTRRRESQARARARAESDRREKQQREARDDATRGILLPRPTPTAATIEELAAARAVPETRVRRWVENGHDGRRPDSILFGRPGAYTRFVEPADFDAFLLLVAADAAVPDLRPRIKPAAPPAAAGPPAKKQGRPRKPKRDDMRMEPIPTFRGRRGRGGPLDDSSFENAIRSIEDYDG